MLRLVRPASRLLNKAKCDNIARVLSSESGSASGPSIISSALPSSLTKGSGGSKPTSSGGRQPKKENKETYGEKEKGYPLETWLMLYEKIQETDKHKIRFNKVDSAKYAAIAKNFGIECMKRHNKMNKDLTTKIWLQQEALRALPKQYLEHAQSMDNTTEPLDRPLPEWDTPPIKGFDSSQYKAEGDIGNDKDASKKDITYSLKR